MKLAPIVLATILHLPASAQSSPQLPKGAKQLLRLMDLKAMRGIRTVTVGVEDLSQDAVNGGLSVEVLKNDVELKFRSAQLKVSEAAPDAVVEVSVGCLKSGNAYAASVRVELHQNVALTRDPTVFVPLATTWAHGDLLLVSAPRLVQSVRSTIDESVTKLLNMILESNQ